MSPELIVAIIGAIIVVITFIVVVVRKLPKRVRSSYYVKKWREIQKMCSNKDDWAHAIIHADMLVDEVMIKKKVSGKSMGERMVSTQNSFSANDAIWNAHKLANNLRQNAEQRITEPKIKEALMSFRQAMRDLGAL